MDIFAPTGEKLDTFEMWPDGFVSERHQSGLFGYKVSGAYPPIPEWGREDQSDASNAQTPEVGRA